MRIHKVVTTETANECLLNIAEYIALDSPVRAESFIREIIESLSKTLSVFPLAGTVYEEIETKSEIRKLAYKNYISFYRVNNDVIEILYVFNSAQNVKAILDSLDLNIS